MLDRQKKLDIDSFDVSPSILNTLVYILVYKDLSESSVRIVFWYEQ